MKNQSLRLQKHLNKTVWVVCFAFCLLMTNQAFAQNVGVNTTTPDASAMLDVVSTNSGVLVPRLTMAQRDAIASPATSLLIYQTNNTPGFYYNSGTPASPVWVMIGGGAAGEWTDAGDYLHPNENTSAQVWENNDLYGFYYSGLADNAGFFESTDASVDNIGVYGGCDNTDYFGFGGVFSGGYTGAQGLVAPTGSDEYFGVSGFVDGGTGSNYGIYGQALNGANNYGVVGDVTDDVGFGVYAVNGHVSGTGLLARGNNETGAFLTGGSGIAAVGTNIGVYGTASAAGASAIYGDVDLADGFGVDGRNVNASGTGIIGVGNNATANFLTTGSGGAFSGADGALASATNATGTGLIGIGNNLGSISTLTNGSGVAGNSNAVGVYGYGDATAGSIGVYGTSDAADGWGTVGIVSSTNINSAGVFGEAYYGVYGTTTDAANGWGVYSTDDLGAGGALWVTGAKNFLIDNPENPENEMLRHICIESPEALVVYRGKVKLNSNGEAVVEMPSYFKSLTKEDDATVQVTCVGRPFGIGYEWNNDFNSFVVYGDANREISWMVMADRDDPYMQKHNIPTVIPKDGSFKGVKAGTYLDPESYDLPAEKGHNFQMNSKVPEAKTTELNSFDADKKNLRQKNTIEEIIKPRKTK